jgi:DNA-binding transcriptional LysR family regulator
MQVFAKIAEAGSFAEAARRLRIAPATVTKHVQALEKRIGARLINRDTRRVQLTEAGVLYWRRCQALLSELAQVENEAAGLGQLPRGRLRLTAGDGFGTSELQPAVLEFMEVYPDITVDLELTTRYIDLIKEEFDVAVRTSGAPLDGAVVARRIASSRLITCAAPSYLALYGAPRNPSDLESHACLVYTGTRWGNDWPFTRGDETRKVRVPARLQTNSNLALCHAAKRGAGITIQPSFNVWKELRSGELELVLDEWHVGELDVHVVFPHRQYMPAKVRVFVDFLAQRFRGGAHRDVWLDRVSRMAA